MNRNFDFQNRSFDFQIRVSIFRIETKTKHLPLRKHNNTLCYPCTISSKQKQLKPSYSIVRNNLQCPGILYWFVFFFFLYSSKSWSLVSSPTSTSSPELTLQPPCIRFAALIAFVTFTLCWSRDLPITCSCFTKSCLRSFIASIGANVSLCESFLA